MAEDITCPLKAQAVGNEVPPQPPCDDEMSLFGQTFRGVRTYSIVLLIMIVFSYLAVKSGDVMNMKDLALIACGYMFGSKVATAKR
jgi:hypothetical protein